MGPLSEKILITGATGKVGSEVVRLLAGEGVEVKAATRRPDRAGSLGGGVEVVELDYDRAETYDAAVEWADRLFLVPPPFAPNAHERLASFVDWAVQAGCEHLVSLSGMGVDAREDLPLTKLERHVERTGVAFTFLRPNVYMQNFHPGFLGREIREEGTFHIPAADARVSLVDARDVAAVAAEVLTTRDHVGRSYTLTGPEALDHYEAARVISEAAGREVRYVSSDDADLASRLRDRGWEDDQVEVVLDFFRTIRGGARAGVSGDVEAVLGRPPTSFSAFAGEHAWAWRG